MTKNFKTVVEALNETGFYLAFCNLVVNKIVRIPIKKIISAAGRNIDGITNWLEHAAKDACSAFNQDVPIEDRIMKLEGEILRVTHFCFDPASARLSKRWAMSTSQRCTSPVASTSRTPVCWRRSKACSVPTSFC